jgi:D-amino-acid oxidase
LDPEELPEGISNGVTFDTITIDTPAYLRYLFKQFQDNGGKLVRRKLKRLSSAIDEGEPPLGVFNCSGLGA